MAPPSLRLELCRFAAAVRVLAGVAPARQWPAPPRWRGRLGQPAPVAPGRWQPRSFATAALTVPAQGQAGEQALFVVGLNQGKFFGQDGAEEGLKLLETVAQHHPEYHLLVGLTERELSVLETEHKVKNQRLTPHREIEAARHCEVIPLLQAAMVDKRPRKALDRVLKTSQNHVAWLLWKHPREALKVYWAYWRRKTYKDAARTRFWTEHFPVSAHAYFHERAELIAIRAVEHLVAQRAQGQPGAAVLVLGNELFDLVVEQLRGHLDEAAPAKFSDPDVQRQLRERAVELCVDVPDLTPLLVFVYLGLPLLALQFAALAVQSYAERTGLLEQVLQPEVRE